MSEPFLAEIRMVGFDFAPRGWALCDGQILPINQNQSLYSLLGTTYGGDGRTSFALPDLRGRTPVHQGPTIGLGQRGGQERVALSIAEIPTHDHDLRAATTDADAPTLAGQVLAANPNRTYHAPTNLAPMDPAGVGSTGAGLGHENMQPFRAINYAIALQGLFPSRN